MSTFWASFGEILLYHLVTLVVIDRQVGAIVAQNQLLIDNVLFYHDFDARLRDLFGFALDIGVGTIAECPLRYT